MEGRKLTVFAFNGPVHSLDYRPSITTGQLKQEILQRDRTVPDFDFLYAGKMIRANDKVLGDFMKEENLTLYTNAKGVHGGCCRNG